jgi:hypothetical protein
MPTRVLLQSHSVKGEYEADVRLLLEMMRLTAMGFDLIEAAQAYLACDKYETLVRSEQRFAIRCARFRLTHGGRSKQEQGTLPHSRIPPANGGW